MCFFRRPAGSGVHPAIADPSLMTYMRPEHGDLTIHDRLAYDEAVDPDQYYEGADPSEILRNSELIAHRFPIMKHGLAMGGYSGLYDVTPDHQRVLGPIAKYQGLYANFGWSGHGFKHSRVIGDILSDVVLQRRRGLRPHAVPLEPLPRRRPPAEGRVDGAPARQAPAAGGVRSIAMR